MWCQIIMICFTNTSLQQGVLHFSSIPNITLVKSNGDWIQASMSYLWTRIKFGSYSIMKCARILIRVENWKKQLKLGPVKGVACVHCLLSDINTSLWTCYPLKSCVYAALPQLLIGLFHLIHKLRSTNRMTLHWSHNIKFKICAVPDPVESVSWLTNACPGILFLSV